jgi:hypothetical protein
MAASVEMVADDDLLMFEKHGNVVRGAGKICLALLPGMISDLVKRSSDTVGEACSRAGGCGRTRKISGN